MAVLRAFAERYGITYPLLSDEGSRVIRELGLYNPHLREHHAAYGRPVRDDQWGVPYPGTFILDERGIVVEKGFHQSYRERETGAGILLRGFGLASALAGPAARAEAAVVSVRAYLDSPHYRYFQRLWLGVELDIAPGWHVYAPPVPDGYTPLTVTVSPIEGLVSGGTTSPAPRAFAVPGLEEAFFVYEGRVRLMCPLTFTEDVGDQTLDVTVRFQACSASECLAPDAVTVRLPVRAAAHIEWHA